jgi:hypothetical protein
MFAKESDVETDGNYSLGHLYNAQLLSHFSETPVVGTRLYQLSSQSCGHAARYLQSVLHLLVLQAECRGLLLQLLQPTTVGATLLAASRDTTSTYSLEPEVSATLSGHELQSVADTFRRPLLSVLETFHCSPSS